MFAWGIIGYLAGAMSNAGWFKKRAVMLIYGAFAGILYSLLLDVWATLAMDGTLNLSRYTAALISALPYTAAYAASNVAFLLFLEKPLGEKLNRIKIKYQI
jgi:energy-coupling factor transport system substrate-specific component